jgi:CRP-like cAMP-binding protein
MSAGYESLIPTFPLFEGFTAPGARRLIECGRVNEVAAGAVLFDEGETASVVLLVLAGDLQVFVRRGDKDVVLASATPGTIVGELAVLCGIPRTASVRAAVDSTVLEWDAAAFRRLLLGDVLLSQRIFGQALRTLVDKERALIDALTGTRTS